MIKIFSMVEFVEDEMRSLGRPIDKKMYKPSGLFKHVAINLRYVETVSEQKSTPPEGAPAGHYVDVLMASGKRYPFVKAALEDFVTERV